MPPAVEAAGESSVIIWFSIMSSKNASRLEDSNSNTACGALNVPLQTFVHGWLAQSWAGLRLHGIWCNSSLCYFGWARRKKTWSARWKEQTSGWGHPRCCYILSLSKTYCNIIYRPEQRCVAPVCQLPSTSRWMSAKDYLNGADVFLFLHSMWFMYMMFALHSDPK